MKNLMKKKLNKKGFTLVELIVVIAIVAVLAVVGIPAIAGQVAAAQQSTLDANAKLIASQTSIMVTQSEVRGEPLATIQGIFTNTAAVAEAAGVDDTGLAIVITPIEVNDDGTMGPGGTQISCAVQTVTVTNAGGMIGEFTRS